MQRTIKDPASCHLPLNVDNAASQGVDALRTFVNRLSWPLPDDRRTHLYTKALLLKARHLITGYGPCSKSCKHNGALGQVVPVFAFGGISPTPEIFLQSLSTLWQLNIKIAGYLGDKDLCSFSATCRTTHETITSAHSSVWRVQFGKYFDMPDGKNNDFLMVHYQHRRNVLLAKKDGLPRWADKQAEVNREKTLMYLLRCLIKRKCP